MAGTSAIAKFFYTVESIGINILLMVAVIEICGVTGRAIRLELWRRPGRDFRVSTMAVRAQELLAVVSRIAGRLVAEKQRRPEVVVMAVVAFATAYEMCRTFSCGRDAIMTTRA